MIDQTATLLHAPRGTLDQVIDWIEGREIARSTELLAYFREVFRLAPLVGIDPAIVVAQSAVETGGWTSRWWAERLNPAGIGVTGDPAQNEASRVWWSGTEAARSHVAHLLLYVLGSPDAEESWWDATGLVLAGSDPRYNAYHDAYGQRAAAHTIDDLSGRWAVDPAYGRKIADRFNAIFGGGTMPILFDFDLEIARSRLDELDALRDRDAWITIHNNGNPASDRHDEARFVASGGGNQGVAYHFATDQTGASQILPLDRRGVHAGNAEGNAVSLAIEMCEGGDADDWVSTKEQTSRLLAMIVTGDLRIDFGVGGYRFSLDRVREHRDWPGANPTCPRRLIATDGGAERVVARAREIVAATKPPKWAPKVKPPLRNGRPWLHVESGVAWHPVNGYRRTTKAVTPRQYADPSAKPTRADLPAGTRVKIAYVVPGADGDLWYVGWGGSRMPAEAFA